MNHKMKMAVLLFLAVFSMVLSIWGPEALAKYQDKGTLNEIHVEDVGEAGVGYRYKQIGRASCRERVFITV